MSESFNEDALPTTRPDQEAQYVDDGEIQEELPTYEPPSIKKVRLFLSLWVYRMDPTLFFRETPQKILSFEVVKLPFRFISAAP